MHTISLTDIAISYSKAISILEQGTTGFSLYRMDKSFQHRDDGHFLYKQFQEFLESHNYHAILDLLDDLYQNYVITDNVDLSELRNRSLQNQIYDAMIYEFPKADFYSLHTMQMGLFRDTMLNCKDYI